MAETVEHRRPERRGLAAVVQRHPIVAYCVLLAALSWPAQILLPLAVLAVGPSVCAFVVVGVADGRQGVRELGRRVLRWRVPGRYYLFAVVVLGAYLLGTVYLFTVLLYPEQLVSQTATNLLIGALINFPIILVAAGLGEEFGWRGFAQTRLQDRHGPLTAALIVGVLWAVWHIPIRTVEAGGINVLNLVWTVVGITAASCVYAWLFNSTGGSVLLVAILHAGENTWMGTPFILLFDRGSPDFYFFSYVWNAFYVVLAVAVVLLTRGRLGRTGNENASRPHSGHRGDRS